MSTDISVERRSICRPTVDRYVGRDIDRNIGQGVRKLHMIPFASILTILSIVMYTGGFLVLKEE